MNKIIYINFMNLENKIFHYALSAFVFHPQRQRCVGDVIAYCQKYARCATLALQTLREPITETNLRRKLRSRRVKAKIAQIMFAQTSASTAEMS